MALIASNLRLSGEGEGAEIGGSFGDLDRKRFDIADLDILRWIDAGPFGARAQEPALLAGDARRVKRTGGEKLHQLAAREMRPDHDELAGAAFMQQQHLDRVAEIIMVEPIAFDAVELHRRLGRHHEIERRAYQEPLR